MKEQQKPTKVIDKEINITKDDKGYNKELPVTICPLEQQSPLEDEICVDEEIRYFLEEDVKQHLVQLQKRIRELPNRDDKIHSQIKILDGGGVGRFEVLEIIKQEMGESLCTNHSQQTKSAISQSFTVDEKVKLNKIADTYSQGEIGTKGMVNEKDADDFSPSPDTNSQEKTGEDK